MSCSVKFTVLSISVYNGKETHRKIVQVGKSVSKDRCQPQLTDPLHRHKTFYPLLRVFLAGVVIHLLSPRMCQFLSPDVRGQTVKSL